MQLKSLTSSNSKRTVAQVARDTVVCEVLLRAQRPAGKLGADHEHPGLIEILSFFAAIAGPDRLVDRYRGISGVDTRRRKSETRPREEIPELYLARRDSRI